MVLDIDVREGLEAKMDSSNYNANGIFAKELEDELMKYTTKYEDYKVDTHLVEQTKEVQRNTEVDVNITECTKSLGKAAVVEVQCQDTTETSSSFDDSNFGVEDAGTLGDSEALSDFRGEAASPPDFEGFDESFRMRKKKLTTDWRSFIQPLMWRCKWLELQVKKLETQAQQYDRQLEAHNKRKQIQIEDPTFIDGVKSIPYSQINPRSDIHKRKKRRNTEATMDLAAYMSNHNLFSYYENRKCFYERAHMSNKSKTTEKATQKVNIHDEFRGDDKLLSFEPRDGDNSLEDIFCKIDLLQSRVGKMKSSVDRVMNEHAGKFSFIDNLSLPMLFNASPPNNGNRKAEGTYNASQLIPEHSVVDILVPETAATSYGDIVPKTNTLKEEKNKLKEVKIHPIQTSLMIKDGWFGNNAPPAPAEPELATDDQPSPKMRSMAQLTAVKTKGKRGRRRAAGRWS